MQEVLLKQNSMIAFNSDFELFKSNVCHRVRELGQIRFIRDTIISNIIEEYWNKNDYLSTFYLLAMLDYLSRINNIPLYKKYNYIRKYKLEEKVYPISVITLESICGINREELTEDAIPEFLQFNIVEGDVFNVR